METLVMETLVFAFTTILLFSFFMPLFEEWLDEKEREIKDENNSANQQRESGDSANQQRESGVGRNSYPEIFNERKQRTRLAI